MSAYYNEIDPYAAQWLRNLITAGHIAPGFVDERSIEDVTPNELRGYTQCHFFAGIGVWSHALRQAGWPDDKPVWTGSCPCQPFSTAGKGGGFDDERHLWPAFHHLIEQCKPATVIGEQVASKDAESWLDLIQVDLEALDYAFGAVPFPSASVGAPHIRDRLYWVADASNVRYQKRKDTHRTRDSNKQSGNFDFWGEPSGFVPPSGLADAEVKQRGGVRNGESLACQKREESGARYQLALSAGDSRTVRRLADSAGDGHFAAARPGDVRRVEQLSGWPDGEDKCFKSTTERSAELGRMERASAGPTNGFWRDADWLLCRDGKWRPVEPGTFPLAHGATSRVGRLRAYGNAINAKAAQTFIECLNPQEG